MTRYPEECRKQWRPKQGKSEREKTERRRQKEERREERKDDGVRIGVE